MSPGGSNNSKFDFGIVSPETNQMEPLPATYIRPVPVDAFAEPASMEFEVSEDEDEAPSLVESSNDRTEEDADPPSTYANNRSESPLSTPPLPGRLPRLSRSFSMPATNQLGHLRPPTPRSPGDQGHESHDGVSEELADSVQAVVQTLLHISPPNVLDPVKEQFSSCTVQIPTPSVSALLTTMKNLNYMSANIHSFAPESALNDPQPGPSGIAENFDIGEVVQSVGDTLSGIAAQAGVDLVLFHGDVGMKHINVMGDERCILFVLTHIVRQILNVSKPGDAIELGLHLTSKQPNVPAAEDPLAATPGEIISPDILEEGAQITCMFDITHRHVQVSDESLLLARLPPKLESVLLRRLLTRLGTALSVNSAPTTSLVCDTSYSFTLQLTRGPAPVPDTTPSSISLEEDETNNVMSPPSTNLPLAKEPTLEELAIFSETALRGKRVALHASESSTFARHMTSYLTSWGMDVVHVPVDTNPQMSDKSDVSLDSGYSSYFSVGAAVSPAGTGVSAPSASQEGLAPSTTPKDASTAEAASPPVEPSFIIIDDNVDVLRWRLNRYRPEVPHLRHLHPSKRPSLAANHRSRSSPQVRQVLASPNPGDSTPTAKPGRTQAGPKSIPLPPTASTSPPVIVHITSLANYMLVKDTIQSAFILVPLSLIPDVIVIPKPAGPRRFLTALHTAVSKPFVDPYFFPIATSPQSPGGLTSNFGHLSPLYGPLGVARSASSKSSAGPNSPTATRGHAGTPIQPNYPPTEWIQNSRGSPRGSTAGSPDLVIGAAASNGGPSPPGGADSLEYFSTKSVKLGGTGSSGFVLQSPDGRPAGILFQPQRSPNVRAPADGLDFQEHEARRTSAGPKRDPVTAEAVATPKMSFGSRLRADRKLLEERTPVSTPGPSHTRDVIDPSSSTVPSGNLPRPISRKGSGGDEDESATPTAASFPRRLSRSRPSSSHSRPTSSQGPRDAPSSSPPPTSPIPTSIRLPLRQSLTSHVSHEDDPIIGPIPHERRKSVRGNDLIPGSSTVASIPNPNPLPSSRIIPPTNTPLSSSNANRSEKAIRPPIRSSNVAVLGNVTESLEESPSLTQSPPPTFDEASPSQLSNIPNKINKKSAPKTSRRTPGDINALSSAKIAKVQSAITPPISVLIVEDNPINQTILTTWMRRKKLKYATADNGQKAVEKWRTGQFHLILMDIQMPVMDGIQATKEIRRLEKAASEIPTNTPSRELLRSLSEPGRSTPSTPFHSSVIIVALTASSSQSARVEALAAGCNDFLTKPVSLKWLDKKIIEWGSIKALQMWASPDVTRDLQDGQDARAQAFNLHIPGTDVRSPQITDSPSAERSDLTRITTSPIPPSASGSLPLLSLRDKPEFVTGEQALSIHLQEREKEAAAWRGDVVLGKNALPMYSPSIASVLEKKSFIQDEIFSPGSPAAPSSPGPSGGQEPSAVT